MKQPQILINGKLCSAEDAKISVFDRGFLFGDSVYEVTRTYDRVPMFLEDHLDRLYLSSERLGMVPQYSREELTEQMKSLVQSFDKPSAYIRIILTRGEGDIGLDPALASNQNLVMIIKEQLENPKTWYEDGVGVIIPSVLRNPKDSIDPNIKSGNYLNNVLAYIQAKKVQAHEAIMLNQNGEVTEGTTSNIWIVKAGKIMTPKPAAGLLEGITRKTVMNLAENEKMSFEEKLFSANELRNADEAFITSSTREVVPVTSVDGRPVGDGRPGAVTKSLHELYKNEMNKYMTEFKKHHSWT